MKSLFHSGDASIRYQFINCLLSAAGLFVTWELSFSHAIQASLPCGFGGGCDAVARSSIAVIAGIPLAYMGFATYIVISCLVFGSSLSGSIFPIRIAAGIATVAACLSLGLTTYSITILHATCLWCLSSNVIFALLVMSLGLTRPAADTRAAPRLNPMVLSAVVFALFASASYSSSSLVRNSQTSRLRKDVVAQFGAEELAPPDALELVKSSAPTTYVIFADMECPMCHRVLSEVASKWNPELGSVIMRHYVLPVHADGVHLAEVVDLARMHGKGQQFLLRAIASGKDTEEDYYLLAKEMNLKVNDPRERVTATQNVNRDLKLASQLGVSAAPTIVKVTANSAAKPVSIIKFEDLMSMDRK